MRNHEHRGFTNRHKVNLAIFWLKDEHSNTLPIFRRQTSSPQKSWKTSKRTLKQFAEIATDLGGDEKRQA
jgi:hypothetical protein